MARPSRRPGFTSQHLQGSSQLPVTLVPWDQKPSSGLQTPGTNECRDKQVGKTSIYIFKKQNLKGQVQWYRQISQFEASLVYTGSSGIARAIKDRDTLSLKTRTKTKTKEQLVILLPQPLEHWDNRCASPCPVISILNLRN